jgi:hypothetical protein
MSFWLILVVVVVSVAQFFHAEDFPDLGYNVIRRHYCCCFVLAVWCAHPHNAKDFNHVMHKHKTNFTLFRTYLVVCYLPRVDTSVIIKDDIKAIKITCDLSKYFMPLYVYLHWSHLIIVSKRSGF